MTKQLIALALAAAFGIAHAADSKPATDAKPAALKVAADNTGGKTSPDAAVGNTPETTAPAGTNAPKKAHKKSHHKHNHKKSGNTTSGDQGNMGSSAPASQPAK